MRRISFILTLLGIFILFLILLLSKPIPVSSPEQLKFLNQNQKILLQGKVIKESLNKNSRALKLDNNLSLTCEKPCPSYLNQNIQAIAVIEEFNSNKYLKVLKIQ